MLTKTNQTRNDAGREVPLYRVADPAALADALRCAAADPDCRGAYGQLGDALDALADMFDCNGDGGEPWTEDDKGRDLWDLSDFEVAVIKAAVVVGKRKAAASC